MRLHIGFLVAGLAGTAALLVPDTASAEGFSSCGDIEISAEATCKVEVEGGCTAQCTPVSFELSCEASCDGECSASITGECSASCEADCSATCEVNPGSFDCQAHCEGECGGSCSAYCEAHPGEANCQANCSASCRGECKGSCNVDPPEANCQAECKASCSGKCEFEANAECDVQCNAGCTSELQGGCEVECSKPEGAVFCDGQYVDKGNNAEECLDAIEAALDIQGYASAEAECSGNECTASAEAGCGSIAGVPARKSTGYAAVVALLGLAIASVRRRKSRES